MDIAMTREECERSIEGLSIQIENYAELIVRKGCALKQGQELVVSAPVERADFVRTLVEKAYEAGAGHVTMRWYDDTLTRLDYEHVALEYFQHTPSWQIEQLNSLAEAGAAFLFLEGSDPSAFKDVDPAKPAAAARARNTECVSFRNGMDFGKNVWCIAGVPVRSWAQKVYPNISADEALYRLWAAILHVARSDGKDPQSAWETHNATFEKNKRLLNDNEFAYLHYISKNGTDLKVGLPEGHIWEGGAAKTVDGTVFFPNIPTEEVFTTPDRLKTEGIVFSALPLVHAGSIISDFWLRFEEGHVVDFDARQGKDVLQQIIHEEGGNYLGECALISKNTPIRQLDTLFYNTLYDENASCHLALGMGFPECIKGGLEMSKDELMRVGVNQSSTHVDFMIGTDDMAILGVKKDGTELPLFVNGQWAWELA